MKNLLTPYYPDSFDLYGGGTTLMAASYLARWSGPVLKQMILTIHIPASLPKGFRQ